MMETEMPVYSKHARIWCERSHNGIKGATL